MRLDNQADVIYVDEVSSFSGGPFLANGVYFPTTGGGPQTLDYYETETHTTNWSGIWASAQSGNVFFSRIGTRVTLLLPQVIATATTADQIDIVTALPTRIRPADNIWFIIRGVDAGTIQAASILLNTDGTVAVFRNVASADFTGSGTSGFYATTLTYVV